MTLVDLAKALKVSVPTVSRALNPSSAHLVAEPVRRRIQAYAARKDYQPNQMARSLVRGRSQTISVIVYSVFNSPFFDDYLSKVQWGINSALEKWPAYAWKSIFLPRGKSLGEVDQHLIGAGVDGILISTLCDATVDRMRELAQTVERRWHRPVVALNLPPFRKGGISTVSFDNESAAYKAVSHLIQRGRRHIGLIGFQDGSPDTDARIRGFRRALADHKRLTKPRDMVFDDSTVESGYQSTLELFRRTGNKTVSALFCLSDEIALGVLRALKALGKEVPRDVAVMGFDGLPLGEYTTPRLSSVLQPTFEIAKAGTSLLIDLIEGRAKTPTNLTIDTELILRDSA